MVNGFEKTLYITKEQMENHFIKYSKTYAKNKSFYIATFDEMALKTVLTSLLRKWVIMSVELQQAYKSDKAVITTNNENIYIDNDITVAKNQRQMSNEPVSNNINTSSYTEIADTNDNVVKEEDISNVVPVVNNNNDEDVYAW